LDARGDLEDRRRRLSEVKRKGGRRKRGGEGKKRETLIGATLSPAYTAETVKIDPEVKLSASTPNELKTQKEENGETPMKKRREGESKEAEVT